MEETKLQNPFKVESENKMMENMKREYWRYIQLALVFAVLFVVCLYQNLAGITAPFFAMGMLALLYYFAKTNGIQMNPSAVLIGVAIVAFGISSFFTTNEVIIFFNYAAGIFLLGLLVLSHLYDIKSWKALDYFGQYICYGVGILENLMACFSLHRDHKEQYGFQKRKKRFGNGKMGPVILGIACAIPAVIFVGVLLISSDVVFRRMTGKFLSSLFGHHGLGDFIGIIFWFGMGFLWFYGMLCYFAKKQNSEYIVVEIMRHEPLVAIGFLAPFLFIYVVFSWVQIGALFLGNMQLPEEYTYAEYAREGFWQLLFVCLINFGIIMICYSFFEESKVLKIMQTLMVVCTYIMILSAAFRMGMYAEVYGLTRKRVLVFWALAVLAVLFLGVLRVIWNSQFPLFRYGIFVVMVLYFGLSISRMDYWIAYYNLMEHAQSLEADVEMEWESNYEITKMLVYLEEDVSLDAAPVILQYYQQKNDWKKDEQMKNGEEMYEDRISEETAEMGWRSFNFSKWMAKKALMEP